MVQNTRKGNKKEALYLSRYWNSYKINIVEFTEESDYEDEDKEEDVYIIFGISQSNKMIKIRDTSEKEEKEKNISYMKKDKIPKILFYGSTQGTEEGKGMYAALMEIL